MIPILVLKTENKVIYNKSNLNCKTFFEEFRCKHLLLETEAVPHLVWIMDGGGGGGGSNALFTDNGCLLTSLSGQTCNHLVNSAIYVHLDHVLEDIMGPFIYVLGTQPRQNVLGTCYQYTSVHITSTVKCSRYPFVQG